MPNGTFEGLRVLALESRRAREIAKLITNYGGEPLVVPSVREVPLESNSQALEFARKLSDGQIDMVIFTTGVGARVLAAAVESVCSREQFAGLLNKVAVIARGPKPVAALRELGVRVNLNVPEPNTWRDLLMMLDENKDGFPLQGRRVAVQEYGVANPELSFGLEQRGATVIPVCVYQWALPEDTRPLQGAVTSIMEGKIDIVLLASSIQIRHLFQIAEAMSCHNALRDALSRVVIVSVGPLTSEELRAQSLNVDLECTRPKMGFLVQEAAEKGPKLLRQKQSIGTPE
jgi:uroporphyrinogen-III synthase